MDLYHTNNKYFFVDVSQKNHSASSDSLKLIEAHHTYYDKSQKHQYTGRSK